MRRWSVRALSLCMLLLGLLVPIPAGDKKADKPPRTGVNDANLASFDGMMERCMIDNEVPGAALAVAKDGKLVYARGFGYADPETKALVQPRSRFRIASVSKPI